MGNDYELSKRVRDNAARAGGKRLAEVCRKIGRQIRAESGDKGSDKIHRDRRDEVQAGVLAMHNPEQAKADYEELYNAESQHEIYDVLKASGGMFCGKVADAIGKSKWETRWHLEQMRERGEIECKLGRYSV